MADRRGTPHTDAKKKKLEFLKNSVEITSWRFLSRCCFCCLFREEKKQFGGKQRLLLMCSVGKTASGRLEAPRGL